MGNGLDTQFTRPFPFLQKWVFWFARLVPYHVWTRVVQSMLGLMTKDLWWMHPNAALILTNQKTRVQKYQMQRLTHECAVVDWGIQDNYYIIHVQCMCCVMLRTFLHPCITHTDVPQQLHWSWGEFAANTSLPLWEHHQRNALKHFLGYTRERERGLGNWVRLCPTCVNLSYCKRLLSLHVGR